MRAYLKVLYSVLLRGIVLPFYLLPVKKDLVVFTGLTGGGGNTDYSCNPKYIYRYLRRQAGGSLRCAWIVSEPGNCRFLKRQGVKVYKHFSVQAMLALLTARVIVTNGSYAPWFPFRKSQYVINTWHGGGAYKKVEVETGKGSPATRYLQRFAADNIDLFLASCKAQEEHMLRGSYGYNGEILRAGTPRNDLLVKKRTSKMAMRARRHYGIPDDAKIVLYAPTYRNIARSVTVDADAVVEALEKDGSKWVFLSRFHRYQQDGMGLSVLGSRIVDVADYPDMQELLAACSVLITDFSSVVWDYGFLERPAFLFVPDEDGYLTENGFYTPFADLPYPRSHTMDELTGQLAKLRDAEYLKELSGRIRKHQEKLGSYETGHAAKTVARRIVKLCGL